MISIVKSQVPEYLRNGAFYEALDLSSNESFEVPLNCLKVDLKVDSNDDLRHLLHTLRFWGVRSMLADVFCAVLRSAGVSVIFPFKNEFPDSEQFLTQVFKAKANKELVCALAIDLGLGSPALRTLHEEMGFKLCANCWDAAISKDDVPSLVYLLKKSVPIYKPIMPIIASCGSMKVLRYAHSQQWKCTTDDLDAAIEFNRVECVKFLHDVCGVALAAGSMRHAAQHGQLPLIQYLHKSGCSWEPEVCAVLASRDLLGSLMFARKNGCPWDQSTCSAAARHGFIRCLQYAHQQGCPWDSGTIDAAYFFYNEECYDFALSNGCPGSNEMRCPKLTNICAAIIFCFLTASVMIGMLWGTIVIKVSLFLSVVFLAGHRWLVYHWKAQPEHVFAAAAVSMSTVMIFVTIELIF